MAIVMTAIAGERAVQAAAVSPQAAAAHATITEYTGPATCVACHETEAQQMFGTVHYLEFGPAPNVPNIPSYAGKGRLGFNTYCGSILSSRRSTCWTCHISYGKVPQPKMTTDQLNNIDCLMCHQDQYQRKAAGPVETLTFTDYLGASHTWKLPIEDAVGNFVAMPDEAKMTITALQAAQTVHRPTRGSCLRCHAGAGGADGTKRGDLSSVSVDPPLTSDIHMSSQGGNLSCQACHQTANHHMLGRGLDLRENDRPERLSCTLCHPAQPHSDTRLNNHAGHIACQTCHIPTYAKDISTETARDWQAPFWSPGLLGGQGGYKPGETRGTNLRPTYAWFDGTSQVYILGQTPPQNAQGQYELATPYGGVNSPTAQIFPMKEHTSNSARHDATGQMIPHSTFKYFVTGDFSQAVADGMAWAGLSGSWTLVNVHTYQTLNHGVEPKDNALLCAQCHKAYSGGAPVRMDLQGKLGYELKGPLSQVCSQCHSQKSNPGFASVHDKHVRSRRYDCAWCHKFTRPERGLRATSNPPAPPTPPARINRADFDGDGDVDTTDFGRVQSCFNGPNRQPARNLCDNADLDVDGDVDLADFGAFQSCFNGPNNPARCP
ncbi:MAG: multiheme c-type cytochrome [Phycisphaerae bacterium]